MMQFFFLIIFIGLLIALVAFSPLIAVLAAAIAAALPG